MLWRQSAGELPEKHHTLRRGAPLRHELCLTRDGFAGAYTILYHEQRPQAAEPIAMALAEEEQVTATRAPSGIASLRRHFWTDDLPNAEIEASDASIPLLHNEDVTLGIARPTRADARYTSSLDDHLWYIHEGHGILRSGFGDLAFQAGDYLCVPKGVIHRFELEGTHQYWLSLSCRQGFGLLRQWRNEFGQLTMDAPYCERDFKLPVFRGPIDEGLREVVVRGGNRDACFRYPHSPLDVVGYDGTVLPWVFPIARFQPRVGQVHLPPTWHGTFACRGALISSFVPRPLDFHPDAIPCPYPHASVDMDEAIFYAKGEFTSRTGIRAGSLTWHARGIPHGPQPGRYEASIGAKETNELAVMFDSDRPLLPTPAALGIEDPSYERSFC